jgi:hypothetical protein
MFNKFQIFPITYFKSSIEDNESIKKILVPKIMEDAKDLPIPEGWFTNKLMTSFLGEKPGKEIFFGEDRTYQSLLETRYANCLDNFFENIPYKILIDEIWYNCYIDGEFQESHDHLVRAKGNYSPAHFSCIHFLSFDKTRHNPVSFHDPIQQIRCFSYELNESGYNSILYPDINEGDFIMFPSYLIHSVEPSPPTLDYPRITISMNIRVMEYGY